MEISLKKPNTVHKQTQGEDGRPLGSKFCFRKQTNGEMDLFVECLRKKQWNVIDNYELGLIDTG